MRSLFALLIAAAISPFSAGCEGSIVVDEPVEPVDATLTVANDRSFVVTEIPPTGVHSSTWGPNLIPDAMLPGESVVIVDIACGRYDVMVTDETGVDCVL